jgi:hypothetical protein
LFYLKVPVIVLANAFVPLLIDDDGDLNLEEIILGDRRLTTVNETPLIPLL